MKPKTKGNRSYAPAQPARDMVESTFVLYLVRVGTPVLLAAIGTLTYGAWSDLKDVGRKLSEGLMGVKEQVLELKGVVSTETQIRAMSDEELKRRIRDIERTEKRTEAQ
jgi:hypothetical protein